MFSKALRIFVRSAANLGIRVQDFKTDRSMESRKRYSANAVESLPQQEQDVGLVSKHKLQKLSPVVLDRVDLRGLGLCGQATKGTWGMSWRQEALKGVEDCEKLGVAVKRALIPRFPNCHALNP